MILMSLAMAMSFQLPAKSDYWYPAEAPETREFQESWQVREHWSNIPNKSDLQEVFKQSLILCKTTHDSGDRFLDSIDRLGLTYDDKKLATMFCLAYTLGQLDILEDDSMWKKKK